MDQLDAVGVDNKPRHNLVCGGVCR
jgi:hypothetical protein